MRIYDYLKRSAAGCPEKEAIVSGQERISYSRFLEEVDRAARAMLALGVQPGERVGVLLPNWPQFGYGALGAICVGATAVMLNIRLKADEILCQLQDAAVSVLILVDKFKGRDYLEMLASIRDKVPGLRQVVVVGEPASGQLSWNRFLEAGKRVSAQSLHQVIASRRDEETIAIIYTSGTTGRPKGVMFGHSNFVRNSLEYVKAIRMTPGDRRLTVVPMYHTSGVVAFISTCFVSATIVLLDDFRADECLKTIERERCTILGGVPTILVLLLRSPLLGHVDISTLRVFVSFGAPLQPSLVKAARSHGIEVLNVYGMTEIGVATFTQFGDTEKNLEETVGRPSPVMELKVVDGKRKPVLAGEIGELAVRSDTIMQGYFNKEEATRACLDADGWLYTGDLGRLLPDGYLQIIGRIDDMYIRGGVNVYPKEIEDVLGTHPGVQLCTIVGVPDPVMGQVGRAYIVRKAGDSPSEDEIRAFLAERIADYKVPLTVEFRPQLPVNATGKILKKRLEKEYLDSDK